MTTCTTCNKSFECSNCATCWCSSMPTILSVDTKKTGCFCPDCLLVKIKEKVAGYIQDTSDEKTVAYIKSLGTPSKLIEDIDYTVSERGLYVFTSWYLLRRGYCCENNCTNCPYPKIN